MMAEQQEDIKIQRYKLVAHIEELAEGPVAFLGFVWLALLIVEMISGLSHLLSIVSGIIYAIFILDFLLRMLIAPDKLLYFRKNWLIAVSLFVPAIRFIRVLRVVRILRVVQGGSILTMIASVNRSMRSLNATLKRRGFKYIILLTVAVIMVGAAGMYAFERKEPGAFKTYADAVWWTIMLLITIGSEYWPKTPAGKTLSVLISVYGFSVLGYITATLASFFVDKDAANPKSSVAGADDIAALRKDIRELSKKVDALSNNAQPKTEGGSPVPGPKV